MKYFFYPERRFVTFAPIMSNNPKSPIIDLQQQQLLLRMEYEYEKEEFKRQTETMGVARKVKRGLCWYPVSLGRSYYNSLNQLVIDITRTENKEIEHSSEFGRPVCFFHQSFEGKVKYMDFIATISFADEERMVVVLPGAGALAELQTDGILGVQLYFDETSYRAMFEALEDTIRAKDNRLAELRDILLGTQKPGFRELYPVRFPWLNSTQETAVNKVLCTRDVSIVHGPPGTGKTTTLVEAIYETLHREPQVLVCAQSNTAVDWICEKLVDRGVPVLRIGNPTRVNDKMLSSTYERRFESHPAYPELWGIRKSIREMGSRMRRGSYSEREGMRNRMSRLRDRATELEIQINADLFDSARVSHGVGNTNQCRSFRQCPCDCFYPSQQQPPPAQRTSFFDFIHRRSCTSPRSCLLDRYPQSRPGHPCRRSLSASADYQMYRSFPWRIGSYINGKSRSTKTFRGLSIKSTVQNA